MINVLGIQVKSILKVFALIHSNSKTALRYIEFFSYNANSLS